MIHGTVAAVLKSGGDFKPAHAEWLREQVAERMPNWSWRLWTDFDVPGATQLKQDLPKWWSKYEIYADETLDGPSLVLDLDTVILKEWAPRPEHRDSPIVLNDPFQELSRVPRYLGGVLYLPKPARQALLAQFRSWTWGHPEDDQPHLRAVLHPLRPVVATYHYPDQFVSYKVHVQSLGLRPENKIVYFHGKPRPWDAKEPWVPSPPFPR